MPRWHDACVYIHAHRRTLACHQPHAEITRSPRALQALHGLDPEDEEHGMGYRRWWSRRWVQDTGLQLAANLLDPCLESVDEPFVRFLLAR